MSPLLRSAALVLLSASYVLGQAATPTVNPLNEFIGAANSAASVINSAHAQETIAAASASSVSASAALAAAAASTSPSSTSLAKPSNSHRNMIIAIVCGVIGALILLAILLGICCILRRHGRRRRRSKKEVMVDDDEKTVHQHHSNPPLNPGRTYTPVPQNRGFANTKPTVPLLATTGMTHHASPPNENPFVPVPPSPRKPAYSNSPVIDTTPRDSYHDAYAYGPHEASSAAQPFIAGAAPIHTATPRSRSNSRPRSGVGPPLAATADRPATPFGLNRIGQPYDDMHVHVLQTDAPSADLRRSLYERELLPRPPQVPSRSPARQSAGVMETSYQSSTSNSSTTNSGSEEDWRRSQAGAANSWTPTSTRYSDGSSGTVLPAPPVPWDHGQPRRHSGDRSPRMAMGPGAQGRWTAGHDRQESGTSINGQPRRLRFSDLQADSGPPYENHRDNHRHPPVVGEAL